MTGQLDQDFFRRKRVQDSVKQLKDANPLVLFIGAGVSASQGLPTWTQLLRELLDRSAERNPALAEDADRRDPSSQRHDKLSGTLRREYVDTVMRTSDLAYLGSLVRQTYPDLESLRRAIRERLYGHRQRSRRLLPDDLASSLVAAVCRLVLARKVANKRTLVVTTNYDDVLETAFSEVSSIQEEMIAAGIARVVPITSGADAVKPDELQIYHLHGYVPRRGGDEVGGDIILSAKDYTTDWTEDWTYHVLQEHWGCQWLFVGMSLTDPHVTFYVVERQKRAGGKGPLRPPVGMFSLQGKEWSAVDERILPPLVSAEIARLAEVGMQALPTDYFFQDAQFLREVALATRPPASRKTDYVSRRARWETTFAPRLAGDKAAQFLEHISDRLLEIRRNVEGLSGFGDDELFKVELWCRDVTGRALFELGTSEYTLKDPSRSRRFPLATQGLGSAAVAAFTKGKGELMDAPAGLEHGRWRAFFAAPLTLTDAPWHELPVGSIVIASTKELRSSTLPQEKKKKTTKTKRTTTGSQKGRRRPTRVAGS